MGFRTTQTAVPFLPDSSTGKHLQGTVNTKEYYGREEISIRQIEVVKDQGTFIGAMADKTEQLLRDFRDGYGIALYNNQKGFITTVGSLTGITTTSIVVVDKVRLQEGNVVDVIDITDGEVLIRNLVVSSYDDDTKTVTFDISAAYTDVDDAETAITGLNQATLGAGGAKSVAVGDGFVFVESYNLSYNGLDAQILEAGTMHNIDRDTHTFYKSAIQDASNTILTNKQLRLLKNKVKIKARKDTLDCIITNYDEMSGFEDTLDDNVRYAPSGADIAPRYLGGMEVLKHDGVDILPCRYASKGVAYVIDPRSYNIYQHADTKFLDMGDGVFNRNYQKGLIEFSLYNMEDLVCYHPRQNGAIKNIKGLSE